MSNDERPSWASVHLDTARGVAALVVVLGHARSLFFNSLADTVSGRAPGAALSNTASVGGVEMNIGREAVMVFFVLSGYLVGGSVVRLMAAQRWSWRDYLVKRLVRLWVVLIPVMFIGLAIDLVGRAFFATPGSLYSAPVGQYFINPATYTTAMSPATLIGNIMFLQEIFVAEPGTNVVMWSLSYEFWYYMAFPALVIAASSRFAPVRRLLAGAVCLAILVVIGGHASFLFLVWLLGAGIAVAAPRIPADLCGVLTAAVAGVFVLVFVLLRKISSGVYADEMIIGLAFSALLYMIKCNASSARHGLYTRMSALFSSMSYTLYLSHFPLLVFLSNLYNRPWRPQAISLLHAAIFCWVIAVAIVWAKMLYWLFESRTDAVRACVERALFKRFAAVPGVTNR